MKKIGIICGFWHDKNKSEDFVLTPYLFLVNTLKAEYKTLGLGICIFRFAIFFAFGQNPIGYPLFKVSRGVKK